MAMKAAVKKAIEKRTRLGFSIFVWRDGKVVEVTAQELRARMAAALHSKVGCHPARKALSLMTHRSSQKQPT